VNPGDCPTLDCTSTRPSSGYDYDHLGVARCFCATHARELEGVRERIAALLAQIEGLDCILRCGFDDQTTRMVRTTTREHGASKG
jgi:hypothetical protein